MNDTSADRPTAVADTHIHLYGSYDWARALQGLADRLAALRPGGARVGFLAEKAGVHAMRALRQGAAKGLPDGTSATPCADGAGVILAGPAFAPLYLIGGRQVATAERIEILALTVDADIPDGIPAAEAVRAAEAAGGVAVLTWAFGKWLFSRRRVVAGLLEQFNPQQLLVADTSLRPSGLPEPGLMRMARRDGYRILAGSDPLPASGEERWLGAYASLFDGAFDPQRPVTSARSLLRNGSPRTVGRRCALPAVLCRLARASKSARPTA